MDKSKLTLAAIAVGIAALLAGSAAAEPIKIGVVRLAAAGPIFIAQEKGYFAAEGVPAEIVYFQAGEPVAVAAVSGDIDFGSCGTSAGLYGLALKGALRIVAGGYREAPGWLLFAFVASNKAYDAGLKSWKDIAGHSVGVTTHGSPTEYALALIEQKFHLDPASIKTTYLQSIPNVGSAVTGAQIDVGIMNSSQAIGALEHDSVKLIGWAGDETPWQLAATFTATKNADQRRDVVERFLRAYRKGARDYHDAFTGPDGRRQDGPTAPEMIAIIAKYVQQPPQQVASSISYVDADERLDVGDILHQIAWYKAQGMVKGEGDGSAAIDRRYVVELPAK